MIAIELYHNLADSITKAQASSKLKSHHYGMIKTGKHGTGEHETDKYRIGEHRIGEHRTGEHGNGKYETGEYEHLTIF